MSLAPWPIYYSHLERRVTVGNPCLRQEDRRLILITVTITTLQHIINVTWHCENCDIEKLSRWIRCLFNIAQTSDNDTAEQLLDEVASIVENTKEVGVLTQKPIVRRC